MLLLLQGEIIIGVALISGPAWDLIWEQKIRGHRRQLSRWPFRFLESLRKDWTV